MEPKHGCEIGFKKQQSITNKNKSKYKTLSLGKKKLLFKLEFKPGEFHSHHHPRSKTLNGSDSLSANVENQNQALST